MTRQPAIRTLGFRSFRLYRIGRSDQFEALPYIERGNAMSTLAFHVR